MGAVEIPDKLYIDNRLVRGCCCIKLDELEDKFDATDAAILVVEFGAKLFESFNTAPAGRSSTELKTLLQLGIE